MTPARCEPGWPRRRLRFCRSLPPSSHTTELRGVSCSPGRERFRRRNPSLYLELASPFTFGHVISAVDRRLIQVAAKFAF
jgi:hypothetical protein